MIRVLLVLGSSNFNGTERYAVDIARKLPEDKFEVWIAVPEYGNLSEILKDYGINEFIYDNKIQNKFTLAGAKNLFHFIKKMKFDVVHANTGIIPCIAAKIAGVKLILETKHGLFFTKEKVENLSFNERIHEKVKEFFVDYFIAISQNDKDRMIKYFRINEKKIKVIYNGVDIEKLSEYRELKLERGILNTEKINVGIIGRLTYQKAQDKLIKAYSEFKSEFENIFIRIIGRGEDEDMLKDLIIKNNVEENVEILDYKKNIFDFYIDLDALILTSRYEGIPYVMMEAMVIGIPVITTDVGGISNIIQNNFNGIIIDADNKEDYRNAFNRLQNDKELYLKLTANAFETVREYSIDSSLKNYVKLYSKT